MPEQDWDKVWEFFQDSVNFLEECKYKSTSKYMFSSWEKELAKYEVTISHSLVKIGQKNQMHVTIKFPWTGNYGVSVWLANHQTRFDDLKENIKKYEQLARDYMRGEHEKKQDKGERR